MNTAQSLIQALGSPEGTDRRQAALALGALQDADIAPALVARIRIEAESCVREDLTWALVQHAEAAQPLLTELIGSPAPTDRRTAAHVISKIARESDFDKVAPLVADEVADVAIKAYRAAANTGSDKAVEVLAARLGDGDLLQRDALTTALASIGAAAVPALTVALSNDRVETREHAAEALGYLGEEAAGAIDALELAAADADPQVRIAAASALGQVGESAEPALTRLAGGADRLVAAIAANYLP